MCADDAMELKEVEKMRKLAKGHGKGALIVVVVIGD